MKKYNALVGRFLRSKLTAEFWGARGPGIWPAGAAGVMLAKHFLT